MPLTRLPGPPPRPGDPTAAALSRQLAEALARIHDVDAHRVPHYRLYYDRPVAAPARWMSEPIWVAAAAVVREQPPTTAMGLIHRDYNPENTLWSRGRPTGVVDWTHASWGPLALDVAHKRWNLVLDHGQPVADRSLECYRAQTGRALEYQSYWDLVSLCDVLLDGDDPGDLDRRDRQRLEDYARTLIARRP